VTSLLIEDNSVILSACEKGIIHVQSLKSEFDDITINLGLVPISCMRVKDEFDCNNIRLLIGTTDEQVLFYNKGWLTENVIPIHK
jgi:hypothetical protein